MGAEASRPLTSNEKQLDLRKNGEIIKGAVSSFLPPPTTRTNSNGLSKKLATTNTPSGLTKYQENKFRKFRPVITNGRIGISKTTNDLVINENTPEEKDYYKFRDLCEQIPKDILKTYELLKENKEKYKDLLTRFYSEVHESNGLMGQPSSTIKYTYTGPTDNLNEADIIGTYKTIYKMVDKISSNYSTLYGYTMRYVKPIRLPCYNQIRPLVRRLEADTKEFIMKMEAIKHQVFNNYNYTLGGGSRKRSFKRKPNRKSKQTRRR